MCHYFTELAVCACLREYLKFLLMCVMQWISKFIFKLLWCEPGLASGHCCDIKISFVFTAGNLYECVYRRCILCVTTHLPASYFSCVISSVSRLHLFPVLGIWEAKLSVSNLWVQPAQRQMFGVNEPAASDDTILQQVFTEAGRRQCKRGKTEGWGTDTWVVVDFIAKWPWKAEGREVMWEKAYVWDGGKSKERLKGKRTPSTHTGPTHSTLTSLSALRPCLNVFL